MSDHNSRETLVRAASRLFRQKGYSGVGLTEILKEAGLPKGSLYYHFPGGKAELPTEQEIDQALDYLERVYKKVRDRVKDLDKPLPPPPADAAPPPPLDAAPHADAPPPKGSL